MEAGKEDKANADCGTEDRKPDPFEDIDGKFPKINAGSLLIHIQMFLSSAIVCLICLPKKVHRRIIITHIIGNSQKLHA